MNETFLRKQAWDYFTTHASQRISTFNFYIVLASLVLTTYFSSFKADSNLQSAQLALAVLLVCFSFIFWKLDKRNRKLIKNAEAALIHFESNEGTADPITRIFTLEPMNLKSPVKTILKRDLSYSDCFNLVFLGFASIGMFQIVQVMFHTACVWVPHVLIFVHGATTDIMLRFRNLFIV